MKLLIVTQKVDRDDPILGFFHRWIEEFAKYFEFVTVICLEEGAHSLSKNVNVLSLGKTKGKGSNVIDRARYITRFNQYVRKEKGRYDVVFVHMNPIYVVEAGWFWKLSGKKVALWYTHRDVDLKLRIAEKFVDVIFSAAKESFNLKTKKLKVVGHGIDVDRYANWPRTKILGTEPISILSIGRITPIKNCDTLIEAARLLKERWDKKFSITFVGSPVTTNDFEYFNKVKELVKKYDLSDIVSFVGDVKPLEMPAKYAAADITINLTPTGGLDKAVLESTAAGVPVMTSNTAFKDYFESASEGLSDSLIFKERDAKDLAGKVTALFGSIRPEGIWTELQKTAKVRANVSDLIGRISKLIVSPRP